MSLLASWWFNQVFDDLANQIVYPVFNCTSLGNGISIANAHRARKIETAEKVIQLSHRSTISDGSPKSLHKKSDDSTIYTVPAGKTAELILILGEAGGDIGVTFKIWESDNDDSATGNTKYTYSGANFGSLRYMTIDRDDSGDPITFAAGKKINIEITSGGGDAIAVADAYMIES